MKTGARRHALSVEFSGRKVTFNRPAPMKILIITDAWKPQINGVVRTYEYLQAELQEMGHTAEIIGPAHFPLTFPMPGYSEIHLALFAFGRVGQMISKFKPDHLHIATEGPLGWSARRYALRHNLEFTSCYHTQFPDYVAKRMRRIIPFLEKWSHGVSLRSVKKFHAPSKTVFVATQSLEDQLYGWGFKAPLVRMTRGVDTSIFKPGPKNLFQDLPRPIALYVGRVAIEKNLPEFLAMPWNGTKVIVGTGPDFDDLRRAYPQAHFTGPKTGKDLADHYRSADVFVFSSKTDTFGMVLIEALACGLPVAAHNVTGPGDIITQPFLGVLDENLSAGSAKALALTGTPQERFDYVHKNYSWRTAAHQFLLTGLIKN